MLVPRSVAKNINLEATIGELKFTSDRLDKQKQLGKATYLHVILASKEAKLNNFSMC